MSLPTQELAVALLKTVWNLAPPDFSGLGVVFYQKLDCLPFLQLNVRSPRLVSLPVSGIEKMADVLAGISSNQSEWHDGFHFIRTASQELTHVAQFISPPLIQNVDHMIAATGARQMTAALSTLITGISGVGLLTSEKSLFYFENGKQELCLRMP